MKLYQPAVWLGSLLLLGANLIAGAQELYKWVDKDGRVQYSDRPPQSDVKKVERKRLGDNKIETETLPFAVRQAMASSPVVLYTNACGALCDEARGLLAKRGIPFSMRDPADEAAATEMKARFGGTGVPSLAVGDRNLKGFAEDSWQSALDAAGYPRSIPNRGQVPPPPAPRPAAPPAGAQEPAAAAPTN